MTPIKKILKPFNIWCSKRLMTHRPKWSPFFIWLRVQYGTICWTYHLIKGPLVIYDVTSRALRICDPIWKRTTVASRAVHYCFTFGFTWTTTPVEFGNLTRMKPSNRCVFWNYVTVVVFPHFRHSLINRNFWFILWRDLKFLQHKRQQIKM